MNARGVDRPALALGFVCALGFLGACTGSIGDDDPEGPSATEDAGGGAVACAASLPSGCAVAPSFSASIEPMVQRTCATCHGPGGVAAYLDLTTYANIARLETTELVQLYSCQMPPADAPASATLSLAEREEMMQWITCGYPQN